MCEIEPIPRYTIHIEFLEEGPTMPAGLVGLWRVEVYKTPFDEPQVRYAKTHDEAEVIGKELAEA